MDTDTLEKKARGQELTTTDVTVTAISVTGSSVECEISGVAVTDNAIFVDEKADTTINFTLDDNTGQNVQFDTTNPFGNQHGHCPKSGAKPKPPCSLANPPAPTTTSFTIAVAPTPGRAVSYYVLNFEGGLSCDPIIIHD